MSYNVGLWLNCSRIKRTITLTHVHMYTSYSCSLETCEYLCRTFDCIDRTDFQEMYILQDCPTFSWNIIEGVNCEESQLRQLSRTNVTNITSITRYLLVTSRLHVTLIYISDEVPLIRQVNIKHETVSKLVVNAGSTFSQ